MKVLNLFSISYVLTIACLSGIQFYLCILYFNWQPNLGIKMREKIPDLEEHIPAGGQA